MIPNKRDLKAYARFDGTGRIVPGSLILRRNKPKVGNWKETQAYECCDTFVPPIPTPRPIFLYEIQLDCAPDGYCPSDIKVDGEFINILPCTDGTFESLLLGLQTTFPTATIQGEPDIAHGGYVLTIISGTQVFGQLNVGDCGTVYPVVVDVPALRILMDTDIFKQLKKCWLEAGIGDPNNVSSWNTYFNLPTNGTPFTSINVQISGGGKYAEVLLFGATSIILEDDLFNQQINQCAPTILRVIDDAHCVTTCGNRTFLQQYQLFSVLLSVCTSIGVRCFYSNSILNSCNIPLLGTIGDEAFSKCNDIIGFSFPIATIIGYGAFTNSINIQTFNLPSALTIGDNAFFACAAATTFNLNSCTALGTGGCNFQSFVFENIVGNTISLTVPVALTTCNAGSPDADIEVLQVNNTVYIYTT